MRSFLLIITLSLSTLSIFAAPSLTGITPAEAFSFGPTIVAIQGAELSPSLVLCGESNVCPIRVWFGQAEGRVISASFGRITVEAPAHGDGVTVDVRVRLADGTELVLPQALQYRAHADAGLENFVQYLVPITSRNVPGAHGSLWTSELIVHNGWPEPVPLQSCAQPIIGTPPPRWPCSVPGGASAQLKFGFDGSFGVGAFIYVPRPLARLVEFQLLVRELSRENDGWGAEVPVVPLEAFRQPRTDGVVDRIRLLNVPVDSRYRPTLRIYSVDTESARAQLKVYAESDGRLLEARQVELSGGSMYDSRVDTPAYAQLDPFTDGVRAAGETRVRLEIEYLPPALVDAPWFRPIWAFLSITNNVTQEVTVITPHRP
jgi:hypothetical protein